MNRVGSGGFGHDCSIGSRDFGRGCSIGCPRFAKGFMLFFCRGGCGEARGFGLLWKLMRAFRGSSGVTCRGGLTIRRELFGFTRFAGDSFACETQEKIFVGKNMLSKYDGASLPPFLQVQPCD